MKDALDEAQDRMDAFSEQPAVDALDGDGKPRKQSDVLIDIGRTHELFHSPDRTAFARVGAAIYAIESSQYREALAEQFLEVAGRGVNRNAITDAITTLSSLAKFRGKRCDVWLRCARVGDHLILDPGRDDWRMIEITAVGWRWCSSPAMIRRTPAMQALPDPAEPDFGRIWQYIDVDKDQRILIAAFLLASLRPSGPFPILALTGEQGSGKSTLTRALRRLIDPSASPLRAPPKEVRDLLVGALNGWVLALDNLSYLSAQMSDAMCRISTGGAISERALYSNTDEVLIEVQRPAILNGIEDLAARPDLAQRCLSIELPVRDNNRDEAEYWRSFDRDAPHIFGALLDALVAAVRDHRHVRLPRLPRMADFAIWAAAGLPALGYSVDEFLAAYAANQATGIGGTIDSSPAGRAVVTLVRARGTWQGTAAELLDEITALADEVSRRSQHWPQSARGMAGILARLAPALRLAGIGIQHERSAEARTIRLCNTGKQPSQPSQPSWAPPRNDGHDGHDGHYRDLHDASEVL